MWRINGLIRDFFYYFGKEKYGLYLLYLVLIVQFSRCSFHVKTTWPDAKCQPYRVSFDKWDMSHTTFRTCSYTPQQEDIICQLLQVDLKTPSEQPSKDKDPVPPVEELESTFREMGLLPAKV